MNTENDMMKQKAVFRKMRFPEDQALLYEIHRVFDREYNLTRNDDEYRIQMEFYAMNAAIYHPLVFLVGDKPAGYVRGYDRISMSSSDIVMMCDLVYILPEFRGHGFGRLLMEKFIEFAVQTDAARIDLLTDLDNENAVALYESFGFKGRNRYQMIYFLKQNDQLVEYFNRKKSVSG